MNYIMQMALVISALTLGSSLLSGCGDGAKSSDQRGAIKQEAATAQDGAAGNGPGDGLARSTLGTGCVQGTVIDALSGEPVDVSGLAGDQRLAVLIRDQELTAKPAGSQRGEYFICGVPLEEQYALFAQIDGYQPFQGSVAIASTVAQRSSHAFQDIEKPDPFVWANIHLFPLGAEVKDLSLQVLNGSTPVPGAMVRLSSGAKNMFDKDSFLANEGSRSGVLNGRTNSEGIAVFAAEQLVLGATYEYQILPPTGSALGSLTGDLTVGVPSSTSTEVDNYQHVMQLALNSQPLKVLSCSNDNANYPAGGKVTIVFNKSAHVVDHDKAQIDLIGSHVAQLRALIPSNNASETVKFSSTGTTLTIEPLWSVAPSANFDSALEIVYNNVFLATDGIENDAPVDLADLRKSCTQVRIYP